MKSRRHSNTRIEPLEPLEPRLLMAVHAVLNNNDSGAGSLRQAIAEATSGDTIDLGSLTGTVQLQSPLSINTSVSLIGSGESNLTITATPGVRAMEVAPGATLSIADLRIASVNSGTAGGAIRSNGNLMLARVTFANNVGIGSGGAIYQQGTSLLIEACTFIGNTVTANATDCMGGAIATESAIVSITSSTFVNNCADGGSNAGTPAPYANGGALLVLYASTLTVSNSTFTGNFARGAFQSETPSESGMGFGGAMAIYAIAEGSIVHCTIASNQAIDGASGLNDFIRRGGGIHADAVHLSYTNNLIVDNSRSDGVADDLYSHLRIESKGGNYVAVADSLVGAHATDRIGTTALPLTTSLGPLQNHGGHTQTRKPASGIRDLGVWTSDVSWTDQRGKPRYGNPDPGAFELQPPSAAPTFTTTPPTTAITYHEYTYEIVATDPNGDPLSISLVSGSYWLKLMDHGDGTATLSGTSLTHLPGGQALLRVSDGELSTTQSVAITVVPNQAPTFTVLPAPPVVMHLGQPYSQLISATDPEGDPIHFTAQLPTWLTLTDHGDGTATLWGTPPPGTQLEGFVRIVASDGFATAEHDFIFARNYPPTFAGTLPPTTALFDTPYSALIETNDSIWPYRTITATGLPAWLKLTDHGDGTATLAGTPTDSIASSHTITLRVSDGTFAAEETFELSVLIPRFRLDERGTLTVIGGVGRDDIQVWVRENQVRAVVNGDVRNFALSAVAGVVVYGLDDHDVINVNLRSIPAYALGGGGNDTLNGADEFDTFVGGSGNDSLSGGAGNDQLYGMGGHDYLVGGSGNDYINGAEGNDVLIGNAGNDSLYGGAGNDTLYGKDTLFDLLDGGLGDDLATYDPKDALLDVFSTPA